MPVYPQMYPVVYPGRKMGPGVQLGVQNAVLRRCYTRHCPDSIVRAGPWRMRP
jgi:hypothetical protein